MNLNQDGLFLFNLYSVLFSHNVYFLRISHTLYFLFHTHFPSSKNILLPQQYFLLLQFLHRRFPSGFSTLRLIHTQQPPPPHTKPLHSPTSYHSATSQQPTFIFKYRHTPTYSSKVLRAKNRCSLKMLIRVNDTCYFTFIVLNPIC